MVDSSREYSEKKRGTRPPGRVKFLITAVFPVIALLAVTLNAQPVVEYQGTFTLAFEFRGTWFTNRYSLELQSGRDRWYLALTSPGQNEETYSGSNLIEVVNYYTNGPNAASIRLIPGTRPFGTRLEEHIWTALFSRNFFSGKQPPFNDKIGLAMAEPCVFTEIQLSATDASPRALSWHNIRSDENSTGPKLEGEFHWLNATSSPIDQINIPSESQFALYITTNQDRTLVSYSELAIDKINPYSSPVKETPILTKGITPITDFRVGEEAKNP